MAKQILTSFPFNPVLTVALKGRFGVKWDKAAREWSVSSKAKALEANALIAEVVAFETARRREEVRIERHHVLAARHPEAAIFAAHPLTGELWVSRIPAPPNSSGLPVSNPGKELAALRRRNVPHICPVCGTHFEGMAKSKFCHNRCKQADKNARKKR